MSESELDEPAATSHTPPGWPIRIIELIPSGKAPAKYGPGVYRFPAAMTLKVILPRRGWTVVKATKNYAYIAPPASLPGPPFHISIAVPTEEECLAMALRFHARGESWMGQLGEWPFWYQHERKTDTKEMWHDRASGQMMSRIHHNPPKSSLLIGEWGAWQATVTGEGGDFCMGVLPPSLANRDSRAGLADEGNSGSNGASKPIAPAGAVSTPGPLFEGGEKSVELTLLERNPEARRRCIAHYGAVCQACGLAYEDQYGEIGEGLIHVHHVVPLSTIGEEYEVDPIRDLVPLCANCHHVVHRREPPYTVEEVRVAIGRQRGRNS